MIGQISARYRSVTSFEPVCDQLRSRQRNGMWHKWVPAKGQRQWSLAARLGR